MFLGAFAVGTTEFVPAGLVPGISRDLGQHSDSGLLIAPTPRRRHRRSDPLAADLALSAQADDPSSMALFFVGHVFAALAPNFASLLLARLVISLSHGSYFGLMAILATSLVPPERHGIALAFTFGGISVANVLGVPLGTAIGDAFGWRATFWIVGSIGIVAALAMAAFVPGTRRIAKAAGWPSSSACSPIPRST